MNAGISSHHAGLVMEDPTVSPRGQHLHGRSSRGGQLHLALHMPPLAGCPEVGGSKAEATLCVSEEYTTTRALPLSTQAWVPLVEGTLGSESGLETGHNNRLDEERHPVSVSP